MVEPRHKPKRENTHAKTHVQRSLSKPFLAPVAKFQPTNRPILGRIGSLEIRLAASLSEVEAAQALRYRVFVEGDGRTASRRSGCSRKRD